MDTGAPRTILQATRNGVRKMKRQEDMENLQDLTCACKDFKVSIGDDHGWAKWVPAMNALIGNNVTDNAHESNHPL